MSYTTTLLKQKKTTFYQLLVFFVYQEKLLGSFENTHNVFCMIIVKDRLGSTTAKPHHLKEIKYSHKAS